MSYYEDNYQINAGLGVYQGDFSGHINFDKFIEIAKERDKTLYSNLMEYKKELEESKKEFDEDEFYDYFDDGQNEFMQFLADGCNLLDYASGYDGFDDCLLYIPTYPWRLKEEDKNLTEEDVIKGIADYLNQFLDIDITNKINFICDVFRY